MKDLELFSEIKKLTNGFLAPEIYYEIYRQSLQASEGDIIDIGPAQGGSSISLAFAVNENEKLGHIYSIDRFRGSGALADVDNIENNLNKLNENLMKYGLEKYDTAVVAGRDEIEKKTGNNKISVMFIDADGALDRDFRYFYNRMASGGFVIIDDYEKVLNLQAVRIFLKWRTQNQINVFLENEGLDQLCMYAPLGKHYTIYRFIEYFKEHGYINVIKNIDGTIFAVKPDTAPRFTEDTWKELMDIRKDIEKEFYRRRDAVKESYDKIGLEVEAAAGKYGYAHALLFENYYYAVKDRMQTVKVFEWHKEEKDYIENDLPLQNISFTDLTEYTDVLESGRVITGQCSENNNCKFKNYLNKYDTGKYVMIPVIIQERFWGFLMLYGEGGRQETGKYELEGLIGRINAEHKNIVHASTL